MSTWEDIARAAATIKTLPIRGKEYAQVPERVKAFRMIHPDGSIVTEILHMEGDMIVMRATVSDADGKVLGTGTAFEDRNSSYINKTSFIENCVPLDTEILTQDGWKYYYQIVEGDKALSLNMETGIVEYTEIQRVNTYQDHPIVELKTSRFCVRCTPQHKWVCRSQYEPLHKTATQDLKTGEKIVQNVPQVLTPSRIGRKLGWLMCDCEIARTANGMPSTAYIRQSKHVHEVTDLFGEGRLVKKADPAWMDSYEWVVTADEVRYILGLFGISTYADLPKAMLKASIEDVAGCYESMMLADGEDRGFSSTYLDLVEAVQIMCARLGIATGHIKSRMMRGSTRPIHTLSIKKTDGAYRSEMRMTRLPPCDVWCPTTANGTWFMRQGDFVTLTSNCETSCVGRALGNCGYGIDVAVSSAEEVQNAIDQQEKAEQAKPASKPAPATVTVQNPVLEEFRRFCKENGLKRDALEKYRGIAVANGIIPMKKDWGDYSMDEIKRFETFIVKNREMPE